MSWKVQYQNGSLKRKHNFKDYKNCLEAAQLENKRNYLEKIKLMLIVVKIIKNL